MMRSTTAIISLLLVTLLHAQGPLSISLQQAMDLAAKQSYTVQNSALEAEKALHKVREITALGLPQINGEGSITNYPNVPKQLIPNFFSAPGQGPEFIAAQFGLPWNVTGGLSLNQLLFDGSYFVGLKASKELAEQGRINLEQTEADARNQAAKAYYGVLAAQEGQRLAGESIPLLETSQREMQAMVEAGFMENTDVDRITIQLDQARTQQRNFVQQEKVGRMLLALALGTPQGTPITLTDELRTIIDDANESAISEQEIATGDHVDMRIAENYVRLQQLNWKNERAKALPKLSGFANHQQIWNGPRFDPGGAYPFFPSTLWGLQLNVPIFSSGSRYQVVKQAKINLEQSEVNRVATEQKLIADAEQARGQARTAYENFLTEERGMELSRTIMERTRTKFNNGAGSSFEFTQEQSNFLVAQQVYIQRMLELLTARADLRRALDKY